MMRILLLTVLLSLQNFNSNAQAIEGQEIGIDGFLSASTLGGTFGVGLKYGLNLNEYVITGPSLRWQRTWSNNLGTKYSYNIFGGGAFLHARYKNTIFGGAEFELLKSPISYTVVNSTSNWVPTLFICAGFSREFNEMVRLNLGIYYDLINHVNSPFRQGYFVKVTDQQTGQVVKYLPIIYRISFFFPIGREKDKEEEVIEEDTYEDEE